MSTADTDNPRVIFRDTYCILRRHRGTQIAVQTGNPPEDGTPTIIDAAELNTALSRFLRSEESDG